MYESVQFRTGATGGVGVWGWGVTPPRNSIPSFSRQDCYFSRQTKIFLTNKTTTDMIFTCYIKRKFGYSKFTQQDNHYNRLVKQDQTVDSHHIAIQSICSMFDR
jgi:hypothetical protein